MLICQKESLWYPVICRDGDTKHGFPEDRKSYAVKIYSSEFLLRDLEGFPEVLMNDSFYRCLRE